MPLTGKKTPSQTTFNENVFYFNGSGKDTVLLAHTPTGWKLAKLNASQSVEITTFTDANEIGDHFQVKPSTKQVPKGNSTAEHMNGFVDGICLKKGVKVTTWGKDMQGFISVYTAQEGATTKVNGSKVERVRDGGERKPID